MFDPQKLQRDGYAIARTVFSPAEICRFREALASARDRARRTGALHGSPGYPHLMWLHGDLLSMEELRAADYVLLDERVVNCVKRLLGQKVVYHGDSSVQLGEGERGFHKDCADRGDPKGIDWQGEYRVLRLGIYLQDHSLYSGGLKVRHRSHRYVSHHLGRAVNLDTRAGDIVFWYLTTAHSGNFVRVRGVPRICFHPRLERLFPYSLRVPEQIERMSIFCTFGAPGVHLDHYIEYQSRRQDVPRHWRRCGVGAHLDALAKKRGVDLRRPSADFGSDFLSPADAMAVV